MSYLDETGLSYFWGKIKSLVSSKMDKSTYDPQNKAQDVFGYVDSVAEGLIEYVDFTVTDEPLNGGYRAISNKTFDEVVALLKAGKTVIGRIVQTAGDKFYYSALTVSNAMDMGEGSVKQICFSSYFDDSIKSNSTTIIMEQTYTTATQCGSLHIPTPDDTADNGKVLMASNSEGVWSPVPTAGELGALPISGGTMTGPLTLSGDPAEDLQAATKQYVDSALADITPTGIGAAPASHTHAATDIISGALPIANGGTGGIDSESALYNLITGLNTNMGMYGMTNFDTLAVADAEDGIARGLPIGNLVGYMNEIEKMAMLQTGSYVGTGTYGRSNPCRLQFNFKPQLFILFGKSNSNASYRDMIIAIRGDAQLAFTISHGSNPSSPVSTGLIFSWASKYLTWYASTLNNQLNASGVTYNWLVAGA